MQHKFKDIFQKLGFFFIMMFLGITTAMAQQQEVEMAM